MCTENVMATYLVAEMTSHYHDHCDGRKVLQIFGKEHHVLVNCLSVLPGRIAGFYNHSWLEQHDYSKKPRLGLGVNFLQHHSTHVE